MGDYQMSDRAQRVLDALMKYDSEYGTGYPFQVISSFIDIHSHGLEEDYDLLTADEEKQVIEEFLKSAY